MKKFFVKAFKILNVLLVLTIWIFFAGLIVEKVIEEKERTREENNYNVAIVKVNKRITNKMADKIIKKTEKANSDEKVKAILYVIDSPGGYVNPSFESATYIKSIKKYTVAYIRSRGVSGAYLIASAADSIYSTICSAIGSIAVDNSFIDYSEKHEKEGKKFNNLISGKYKNIYDPNKSLSDDEEKLIRKQLDYHHNNFVDRVSQYRNIPRAKVSVIADGREYYGENAINLGLIDHIVENINDLKVKLENQLQEEIRVKEF